MSTSSEAGSLEPCRQDPETSVFHAEILTDNWRSGYRLPIPDKVKDYGREVLRTDWLQRL